MLANGDADAIEDLKDELDKFNNLGCSIDQFGRPSEEEPEFVDAAANQPSNGGNDFEDVEDVDEADKPKSKGNKPKGKRRAAVSAAAVDLAFSDFDLFLLASAAKARDKQNDR